MDEIPELVDLLFALQGKAAKWFIIGLHLRLSTDELDIIEADSNGVEECLRNVFRKWRSKSHPPSTWRALIAALREAAVGEEVLAEQLEARFTVSELPDIGSMKIQPNTEPKCETSIEVSRRNLVKIKESFATLLKDVAGKLKTKKLDLEMFHFFMVALFPPGTCIPSSNIVKIFEAVTRNGLWSYWHYTPVEKIVAEYAPKDDEMKGWLDKYKKKLSGYKATTKIADAIELYSIDEFEDDPSRRLTVTYDPDYLRRLSLKLKTPVTEKSLEYIDDLWISLAEYFLLPSLSVLLEKIQRGCVEVSWLIPPHYVFQIIGNLQENSSFLQSKGIVKVLLDGDCVYDGAQDEEYKQKLVDAVSAGNIDEMVALLTSGVDVNTTLEGGVTLLMIAAYNKLTTVLSVFLNYGADTDLRNTKGWTALMLACEQDNLEVVEILLEHNAGTEIQTLDGLTAVMIACVNGHLDVVRMLIEKQANINHRDKKGCTCLMAVCKSGHLNVLQFLLSHQHIDVNIKDEMGLNALMYASHVGNEDILQALLSHPEIDINERSDHGHCTALMFACITNRERCVELLLNKQADPNIRDKNGCTALTYCCEKVVVQNEKIIQLLLNHKADPNTQDEDGWTPLMGASSNNLTEIVHEMLKRGADPNVKNEAGETALQIARSQENLDIVELLESCTEVKNTGGPSTSRSSTHPKPRERQVQFESLDLMRSDYRASLENRRIFREILERGSEVDDPPKPYTSSQSWHQVHKGQGYLPEPQ